MYFQVTVFIGSHCSVFFWRLRVWAKHHNTRTVHITQPSVQASAFKAEFSNLALADCRLSHLVTGMSELIHQLQDQQHYTSLLEKTPYAQQRLLSVATKFRFLIELADGNADSGACT